MLLQCSLVSYVKTGQLKCLGHLKLEYEFNKFVCPPTVQIINSPFRNVNGFDNVIIAC